MDGCGAHLGLIVAEGAISVYIVQSRNQVTYLDIRRHIVLQVTDYALNPDTSGRQPTIILEPGVSYTLAWELEWYTDEDAFLAAMIAPVSFSSLGATMGGHISITTGHIVTALNDGLTIGRIVSGVRLAAEQAGTHQLQLVGGGYRAHTEVFLHRTLRDAVNDRA